MKLTGLFLILLLKASYVRAVLGSESQEKSFDSLCRILIYKGDGRLQQICSGGLISNTQILSGRHCFNNTDAKSIYKISCGFTSVNRLTTKTEVGADGSEIYTEGVNFKENNLPVKTIQVAGWNLTDSKKNRAIDPRDVAVVTLARSTKLPPLNITSEDQLEKNLKINGCLLGGFGFAADGRTGVLNVAPLENPELLNYSQESHFLHYRKKTNHKIDEDYFVKNFSANLLRKKLIAQKPKLEIDPAKLEIQMMLETVRIANSIGAIKSIAMPGDSGGPLICKIGQSKTGTIVGTLFHGDYYVDENQFGHLSKVDYDFVTMMTWSTINLKNLVSLAAFRSEQRLRSQAVSLKDEVTLSPDSMPSLPAPGELKNRLPKQKRKSTLPP
jgi:hypothetical protein